jgi:hypothetical protein
VAGELPATRQLVERRKRFLSFAEMRKDRNQFAPMKKDKDISIVMHVATA